MAATGGLPLDMSAKANVSAADIGMRMISVQIEQEV